MTLKNKKVNTEDKEDGPRLVAAATNENEVEVFETFSILQIKMKDEKGKPIYKNRKDMVWAAIELFNKTNSKYLDMPKPYTVIPPSQQQN